MLKRISMLKKIKPKTFSPHPECVGKFLRFCDEKNKLIKHNFYGNMCEKCFYEIERSLKSNNKKGDNHER